MIDEGVEIMGNCEKLWKMMRIMLDNCVIQIDDNTVVYTYVRICSS